MKFEEALIFGRDKGLNTILEAVYDVYLYKNEKEYKELIIDWTLYKSYPLFDFYPSDKITDALNWIDKYIHKNEEVKCPYCDGAEALVIGKTNDQGIALQYPNRLVAYGYDVHGTGHNGLSVRINYCPMCGKELKNEN